MSKISYYSIKPLLDAAPGCSIYMLIGQRANGKSYQVKKECLLKDAYKGMNKGSGRFVYLRRWREDIKQDYVTAYFDDMPFLEITEGKYTGVTCYQGKIFFTYLDEDEKVCRALPEIGRAWALNERERAKSIVFAGYDNIAFEEFITDKLYLAENEPDMLMQFISTVFRHKKGRVFLIGNTLSRVCPYFKSWALEPVLRMKPGDLHIFHFKADDGTDDNIDMAVEYCQNANYRNKMFFGQTAKQIISGEWETRNAPKLPQVKDAYEKVYELMIEYQSFKFILELLIDKMTGGMITFVYPLTRRKKVLRIITETASDNPFISARFDTENEPEALINKCFLDNKVFYSDNLTATDFKHVINAFRIGKVF